VNIQRTQIVVWKLIIGAVMISFSGVWVKTAEVTPIASAFYRVFFGGLILLPAALIRKEVRWFGWPHLLLVCMCGFFFALDLALYHYSVHYVGPGLGTILPNFQVLILVSFGIVFLKENIRPTFLAAIPLALIGLLMIVGLDWGNLGRNYKIGLYCGIGAAFCYATFLLSLRKLQALQSGLSIFYVVLVVSFATAAFLALEIYRSGDTFVIPDLRSFAAIAALAFFSQAVGWIIIANALPQIRASLSGFILLLQPALAFVWDVLFFDRPTNWVNWMGVLIALTAIYLGTAKGNRSKQQTTSRDAH
jgi:drug/metabolite transporter (DMT)-like permease